MTEKPYTPTTHERESTEAREALWQALGKPDKLYEIAFALTAAEERGRRAGIEERDRLIAALREVERRTNVGPPSRPGGPITAGSGWYSTLLSVNAYVHGALAPRDSGKEG